MTTILIVYSLNATLLLLHEIESAYEKEWEILRLPGGITGFLLLHVPIILLLLYGLVEIYERSTAGMILGIALGLGGLLPFLVHEVLVRAKGRFERISSRIIIYACFVTGLALIALSIAGLL